MSKLNENSNTKKKKPNPNGSNKSSNKGDKAKKTVKAVVSTTEAIVKAIKAVKSGTLNVPAILDALQAAGHAANDVIEAAKAIKGNHPEWYLNDPELAEVVNTISAYKPMNTFSYGDASGIATKGYVTRVGYVDFLLGPEEANGFYLASNKLFNTLRRVQSGSLNYNRYTLMSYLHNSAVFAAMIESLKLLYRATNAYTTIDRMAPQDIFEAFCVDYEDFVAHTADVRAYLIRLKKKFTVVFPIKFDALNRYTWLFGNIFQDEGKKSQVYVNVPRDILLLANNTQALSYRQGFGYRSSKRMKYSDIVEMMNYIANYLDNEVYAAIPGDMLKAYGTDIVYKISIPNEDDTIKPCHDISYFTQLENGKPLGQLNDLSTEISITATEQKIRFGYIKGLPGEYVGSSQEEQASFVAANATYYTQPMIETNAGGVITNGQLISATRFIPHITRLELVVDGTASNIQVDVDCSGAMMLNVGFIADNRYFYNLTATGAIERVNIDNYIKLNDGSGDAAVANKRTLCNFSVFSQFDHFPIIMIFNTPRKTTAIYDWQANNFALLNLEQVFNTHYVAAFSLFYMNSKYKPLVNLEIID